MINKEDVEKVIPKVIERISKMVEIPSSGIITGQALANLICEELNLGINGPINDIDFFVPLSLDPSERSVIYKEDKNTFFYKKYEQNEKYVQNKIVGNNYPDFLIAEREKIKIFRSYKDGLRNFTLFNYANHEEKIFNPIQIIKSFDLNCTSVGYLIEKQELIITDVFLDFLNTKELKVYNFHSPVHTLYRLDKKINEIKGITCDLEKEENKLINNIIFKIDSSYINLDNEKHLNKMELIQSLPKLKKYKDLKKLIEEQNINIDIQDNIIKNLNGVFTFINDLINYEIKNGNKNINIKNDVFFNYIEKTTSLKHEDLINFPNIILNTNFNITTNELTKNIKLFKDTNLIKKLKIELYGEIQNISLHNNFNHLRNISTYIQNENYFHNFIDLIKYKRIEFNKKEKEKILNILTNKGKYYYSYKDDFFYLTDLINFLNKKKFDNKSIEKIKSHFSKIINNDEIQPNNTYNYVINNLPLDISLDLFNDIGLNNYIKTEIKEKKITNYAKYSVKEKEFLVSKLDINNFKKINLTNIIDENNYFEIKEKLKEITINYNEEEIEKIFKNKDETNNYYIKLKLELLLEKDIKKSKTKKRKI